MVSLYIDCNTVEIKKKLLINTLRYIKLNITILINIKTLFYTIRF